MKRAVAAWIASCNRSAFLGMWSRIILLVSRPTVFIVLCFLTNSLWGKCSSVLCYPFISLFIEQLLVRVVKLSFFSFLRNKIKQQKMKTSTCALTSLFPVTVLSPVVHSWHSFDLASPDQESLLCSSAWAPTTPPCPHWELSEPGR